MDEVALAKKEICCLRSFGTMVTAIDELAESVTKHVSHAAEKLRRRQSLAPVVHVFIHTNRFRTENPQYGGAVSVPLIEPSADTRILAAAELLGLRHTYRTGFEYKKAGIMLMGLQEASIHQLTLFDTTDPKNAAVRPWIYY